MAWQLVRIRGDSMAPTLKDGTLAVATRYSSTGRAPRDGDVAVVDHPAYGRIVKRLRTMPDEPARFALSGDGLSTAPEDLGTVPRARIIARLRFTLPWMQRLAPAPSDRE